MVREGFHKEFSIGFIIHIGTIRKIHIYFSIEGKLHFGFFKGESNTERTFLATRIIPYFKSTVKT
jgi:hypothetical protein